GAHREAAGDRARRGDVCIEPADARVREHLGLALGSDRRRRRAIVTEDPVRPRYVAISALSRVDDENVAPRATELQGCSEPRVAPADDDDVMHENLLALC